jgi:hypothetical protein
VQLAYVATVSCTSYIAAKLEGCVTEFTLVLASVRIQQPPVVGHSSGAIAETRRRKPAPPVGLVRLIWSVFDRRRRS